MSATIVLSSISSFYPAINFLRTNYSLKMSTLKFSSRYLDNKIVVILGKEFFIFSAPSLGGKAFKKKLFQDYQKLN